MIHFTFIENIIDHRSSTGKLPKLNISDGEDIFFTVDEFQRLVEYFFLWGL